MSINNNMCIFFPNTSGRDHQEQQLLMWPQSTLMCYSTFLVLLICKSVEVIRYTPSSCSLSSLGSIITLEGDQAHSCSSKVASLDTWVSVWFFGRYLWYLKTLTMKLHHILENCAAALEDKFTASMPPCILERLWLSSKHTLSIWSFALRNTGHTTDSF